MKDRIAAALIACALTPLARAEDGPPAPDVMLFGPSHRVAVGGAIALGGPPPDVVFLGPHGTFERKVVKGAPFSADTTTEVTQVLADGNRLSRKTTGRIARDGEGRVRREQSLAAMGPLLAGPEPPPLVVINDPVEGSTYFLEERDKRAVRLGRMGPDEMPAEPPPGAPGTERVHRFHLPLPAPKSESLGAREIEGLRVEGARHTTVIPVGSVGNEKPIEIVSEQWQSPDLEVAVETKHSDPRMGTTEYRLQNIRRGEPDRTLFEVPGDYKLETRPHGFRGLRVGPGPDKR